MCGADSAELARILEAVRGKEASQFETVRHQLKSAPPGIVAALNMAMLDVVGRSVKAPVYQVLGGPTRNKCRALAPLEGTTDAELVDSASGRGKRASRRSWCERLRRRRGTRGRRSCWPRGNGSTRCGRRRTRHGFRAGRRGLPGAGDAASLAAAFERFHLLWLDEPCELRTWAR